MSSVTMQNKSSDEENKTSPRRTRNSSARESQAPSISKKMSGKLPDVNESESYEEAEVLIPRDEFSKKSQAQKLDSVAEAINKMYQKMNEVTQRLENKISPVEDAVFQQDTGMLSQMETLVDNAKSVDSRIQSLAEENLQLRDELDIIKGIVHKIAKQCDSSSGKINQLVARSMEDNLVITGILDDIPKKSVRKQLHRFFQEEMELRNVNDADLLKVYRMGPREDGRHRPILAQCTPDLRRYLLRNAPILRDKLNANGSKYYVNQQLPESVAEQNREIRDIVKTKQRSEEALPQNAKSRILVRNSKVYINGQLIRKPVIPPTVKQLFPEDDDQKMINSIKFRTFRSKPQSGSTFRVSIFQPDTIKQVRLAYVKMFQNFPHADHIAMAAIVKGEEVYNDDGEFGSGIRLLRCIRKSALDFVALFMVREFGGVHLGPRRFKIMMDLADIALEKVYEQRQRVMSPRSSLSSSNSIDVEPVQQDHGSSVDKDNITEHAAEIQEDSQQVPPNDTELEETY